MPAPDDRPDVLASLDALLADDPQLRDRLVRSLALADERARAGLDPRVRDALPWPTDLASYRSYLQDFLRWVPQESADPAWREPDPAHRSAREVSTRLAHLFWLVDQHGEDEPRAVEESAEFAAWLTDYAREWGAFLDTPESFGPDVLQSFLDDAPDYTVEESMVDGFPNAPSGWTTFNQFFARELNPGLRPISAPDDVRVVTSPADCSFVHHYDIGADHRIPATTIKRTHTYGSIPELLSGSPHAEAFAGGTFTHYMLPPSSYHRFHLPVAGRVLEAPVVQGHAYMQVDLVDGQLQSVDAADSGYEFHQTRGWVVLDTAVGDGPDLGLVAVVAVGMAHVASVRITAVPGTTSPKGQQFGFFQFGGSDVVVLLQAGVADQVDTDPGPRKVGSVIATAHTRG
ncbi:phosphatidylserine decarboxylase [Klenkia brasiliensis]|uniref:Phosphatidylserine decarboxylase n=1 Tax=Klenkia brasiliensis TaxID=333142 RepID=A0A1G7PBH5_9ACTN|nr:phosphatidylserine decarboxylase [Klenkia brasiliensis]SDF83574.1 Phosphatidylserine decarboxylase [Klenkia brasiliensis]